MTGFILNTPYTLTGLIVGILSIPTSIGFRKKPYAIVMKIRSFWWAFGYMKNARAMTVGHVVLLSPKIEDRDLEHELVHVQQYERAPLIHPILYYVELMRKGYRNNKYEDEAYRIAGNIYKGK
ncbi:MAG: hypothetical protein A2928_04730 [Candidatus Taylorbacteria bacterium RIFCSPLOWO2_01_FULL_45_15b]|uniref:DUF4157 domain-containing protein n=1 Tax=Candidatus Taylorbacteria bacterium RIFCSPLOWO2_01_FULL_45_15b TaxID=1802319 RepID=A0A1G2NDJ8_9BACT|nr:MAG: hypothetical protein A2928_04730 [Candidatus Taylorbacteria bacterium RIFCSPLOWO2_01_FULL_45_15b]